MGCSSEQGCGHCAACELGLTKIAQAQTIDGWVTALQAQSGAAQASLQQQLANAAAQQVQSGMEQAIANANAAAQADMNSQMGQAQLAEAYRQQGVSVEAYQHALRTKAELEKHLAEARRQQGIKPAEWGPSASLGRPDYKVIAHRETARANALADECGKLHAENNRLLRKLGELTLENERLRRKRLSTAEQEREEKLEPLLTARDRSEWLACLQAAAVLTQSATTDETYVEDVACQCGMHAEALFIMFRKRCAEGT